MKIEYWLETPTDIQKGEIEMPEGSSDEEIEAAVSEEVFNLISWGWRLRNEQ